ncbi:50S ribosomal protein L3 N(5)-glutamine methyltransferase [Parahaliea aestuarii]|uniref:50S ribosomal protein L3 N(5)-glutamine methyltransferase n=1 Tax=Parahaliea aestuarii TaxID=1852021 RepID=A0A5C8ZR78_9GAMM|nr:50S ribosomal protein L3 N(5)-glutamine methyltransferase [Parahaliea aestuarii]TXS90978.1 50S ribosomal protein L3 N(5)-glutamine methyltransferase [Parahaliea aestuarii]
MHTVNDALEYCAQALDSAGVCFGHGCDNAWDEAVQLVLMAMDLPVDADDSVLPLPVDSARRKRIEGWLTRRIEERVPLPYLTGRAWFAGLELRCDERAIVPRSPLGELILDDYAPWYEGPPPRRVLDLCCGGGAIGLAAAHYGAECVVDLLDLDTEALALAQENCVQLGLQGRVECLASDLFSAVSGRRYDIILSNPPYVDAADLASMPAEYHHEPELSLGSGADGLDITRRILAAAEHYLEPHGLLVVEVGNSWEALEAAYPRVPFTWLEFEHGGHGVFALGARELHAYRKELTG